MKPPTPSRAAVRRCLVLAVSLVSLVVAPGLSLPRTIAVHLPGEMRGRSQAHAAGLPYTYYLPHAAGPRYTYYLPIVYAVRGRTHARLIFFPVLYTHRPVDTKKFISLRAPAHIPPRRWNLRVGSNVISDLGADGLGVKSNANWTVTVIDADRVNTAGRMREYDGRAYGSMQLTDPLHVVAASDVSLSTGGTLQTGGPNVTPDWQNFDIRFTQNVRFRDRALRDSWYRIVVTFIGRTGF